MAKNSKYTDVPDGWFNFPSLGKRIQGTRFICFKVPLKEALNKQVPEKLRFHPKTLLSLVAEMGEELGMVMDLTMSADKRHYDPKEFVEAGIEHYKLTREPMEEWKSVTNKYFTRVTEFLQANEDNEKLIGVHCNHGIRRTGELVCKYMIRQMDFTPEDAIKAFNEARGYPIDREHILCALKGGTEDEIKKARTREVKKDLRERTKPTFKEEKSGYRKFRSKDFVPSAGPYAKQRGPINRSWDQMGPKRGGFQQGPMRRGPMFPGPMFPGRMPPGGIAPRSNRFLESMGYEEDFYPPRGRFSEMGGPRFSRGYEGDYMDSEMYNEFRPSPGRFSSRAGAHGRFGNERDSMDYLMNDEFQPPQGRFRGMGGLRGGDRMNDEMYDEPELPGSSMTHSPMGREPEGYDTGYFAGFKMAMKLAESKLLN